jgi:hypothetical protein
LWALLGVGFFAVLATIIVLATAGPTEQVADSKEAVVVEDPVDGGEEKLDTGSQVEEEEPAPPATTVYRDKGVYIGDYVVFGTYNNVPIRWRVVHKEDNGNPMLLSERILSLKSFDSGDYGPVEGTGSNDFLNSNLRVWLNSFDTNVSWNDDSPNANRVWGGYNAYDQEPGFLSSQNFTNIEQSLLVNNEHKVLLSYQNADRRDGGSETHDYNPNDTTYLNLDNLLANYERAYYENISEYAFLLSVKQLHLYVYQNSGTLGSFHLAQPTAEAISNSGFQNGDYLSEGQDWYYWLSSPWAETTNSVRVMQNDGYVGHDVADRSSVGVRPALYINHSSALVYEDGDGSVENPYVVVR